MENMNKINFINWCFKHLNGTEDKYEMGKLVWDYLSKENLKLANKLARLEKLVDEFKLSVEPPTPTKKRRK